MGQLSNFHLEIGCLLFLNDSDTYVEIEKAYSKFINDFGPDDFNSIKQLAYGNIHRLRMVQLISLIRLSSYDSTFFMKLLPQLKQVLKAITFNERKRITETLDFVWKMYFNLNEEKDLAYEIGSILYDLGHYKKSLKYYEESITAFGPKADVYYNQALCHYQLNQDELFYAVLKRGKQEFPDYKMYEALDKLDMS